MKYSHPLAAIVCAIALLSTPVSALDLDDFLAEVNVTARADIGGFRADLSATFDLSPPRLDELFDIFPDPADVYISLRIGQIADVPIERVATEYRKHKGQGWGVIAKNLGIKPGSAEFHALKQGRWAAPNDAQPASRGNGHKGGKSQRGKGGR